MSEKAKTVKVGVVLQLEDKKGNPYRTIALGNTKNKDPKYNRTVQIRVLDDEGNVVAKATNPFLSLYEPKYESDKVLSELVLRLQTEE